MYSDTLTDPLYPDENIYVMYSGGMGSFCTAYLLKHWGYKNVTLYFNDTRTEDEDLYRFIKESVEWLGYPLEEDSDGRDIWQVFKDKRYMGNTRVDPCSQTLKRERSRRFFKYRDGCLVLTGIGIWERDRLDRAKPYWSPVKLESLLVDCEAYEQDKLGTEALTISGLSRPRLYSWGLSHNNCGGFCVKAGLDHYKKLWEASPATYLDFELKEEAVYASVPRARPFLRKTVNGVTRYITLREYRTEYLEPGDTSSLELYKTSCTSCAL